MTIKTRGAGALARRVDTLVDVFRPTEHAGTSARATS
jgi:hypothetical protein